MIVQRIARILKYSGFRPLREGRARSVALGIAAGLLAGSLAGCGISFSIGSLSGDDDGPTGSVAPRIAASPKQPSPLSPALNEEDWRRARSALSVALDPQGNGSAAGWDNPESGLKGTITPVGGPMVKGERICRAFIASMVGVRGQDWLQGQACRGSAPDWSIDGVKAWKRPA